MKVHDYIIELKRPGYLVVDMISRLMLMMSIAVFGYTVYLVRAMNWYSILFAILVVGMLGWWIRSTAQLKKGKIPFYRFGLLLATIGWIVLARTNSITIFYWIAALFFIAVLLEKQVKFPKEIAFNEEGIIINSFPIKSYPWTEVANVVLKDGILTVDFKNNKLIQKETESATSTGEEQEFNEFCKNKLTHNA
jgi:hypothetical protein